LDNVVFVYIKGYQLPKTHPRTRDRFLSTPVNPVSFHFPPHDGSEWGGGGEGGGIEGQGVTPMARFFE